MESQRADHLATVLSSFKQQLIRTITLRTQDTDALRDVVAKCLELYTMLRELVERELPVDSLPSKELQTLFVGVFEPPYDSVEKQRLLWCIRRELRDFPFTTNPRLSRSFPVEDTMKDAKFV